MIALLVVVTLTSLAVAGGLLVYILRLTREERDRSEARAAALAETLSAGAPASVSLDAATAAAHRSQPEPAGPEPTETKATPPEPWAPPDPSPEPASRAGMFDATPSRGGSPNLMLIPVVGILVVGISISAVYLWNRPTAQATGTAAAAAPPLELLALRHTRQGETLVISGLVHNPEAGRTLQGLTAVAFAFDRQGGFLTSSRASLDFPRLTPGDESPFSIPVPGASAIGRYRVSFRTEAGIVPHLDRRSDATTGANQLTAQ
jgi:hypothetical protein